MKSTNMMCTAKSVVTHRISAPGNGVCQEVPGASAWRKLAHGVAKRLLGILELPLLLAQLPNLQLFTMSSAWLDVRSRSLSNSCSHPFTSQQQLTLTLRPFRRDHRQPQPLALEAEYSYTIVTLCSDSQTMPRLLWPHLFKKALLLGGCPGSHARPLSFQRLKRRLHIELLPLNFLPEPLRFLLCARPLHARPARIWSPARSAEVHNQCSIPERGALAERSSGRVSYHHPVVLLRPGLAMAFAVRQGCCILE